VPKQEYLRNRRLRVFAGPNGSGKSTILDQIDLKFDIGFYINADEIEKQLKSTQEVRLSDYAIYDFTSKKFKKAIQNHSIIKKAKEDGIKVSADVNSYHLLLNETALETFDTNELSILYFYRITSNKY